MKCLFTKCNVLLGRFAIAFALGLSPMWSAWGKSFSLDLRQQGNAHRPGLKLQSNSVKAADGILRSFNLDAGAADVGSVTVGDVLSFTLFDDVTLALTLKEQMQSPLGGDVFLAEVAGYASMRTAVVLRTADGLTIDVQDFLNDKVYKVISDPTGVKVTEIKPSHEGKCGCDALEPPPMRVSQSPAADIPKTSSPKSTHRLMSAGDQSETCVDILVAYDKNAASYANSNGGGITNFAQVAVQKMNTALANTGLDASFRFRLVGVCVLNVSATDVHETLNALSDDEEGWADIKTVREAVGADIVTTLIDTGSAHGTTGVGWSLSTESSLSTFGSSAYNVCAVRSVAQSHTMTHECGHNLGAGHSDVQDTQPGPQLYNYSAGYYLVAGGNAYGTIMSYEHENPSGADTTEIPFFSSPNYTYEGVAVGDATHDNTRTIAATFSYAANWNAQKVPMSYDITFEPASGALVDGALDVALVPGKSGAEVRYTLDGSDPTASSPRYTGPVRVTGTMTIKAVTVVNGKCSLPYMATYYSKTDFGYALGQPELKWTTTETYPWVVDTERSVDGLSVKGEVGVGSNAYLNVTITGPATMSFKWWDDSACGSKEILCDGAPIFKDQTVGTSLFWTERQVEIPAGEHLIQFHCYCSGTYSSWLTVKYWIDDLKLYYTPKPVFEPATTDSAETAYSFTGETMVSIAATDDEMIIYYTLDGSDPNGEAAILYEGPFFINKSTRLNAIAVLPGRGASAVASGQYIERHRPKAGEWTRNGDEALEAVRDGGRMIVFLACREGCGYCSIHRPIFESSEFLSWAEVNGVYLVEIDTDGISPGTESISRHFWPLFRQIYPDTGYGTPTYVFASGADPTVALGVMAGTSNTSGKTFDYTLESLIECFASYLDDGKPLGAPVASVTDAYGKTFPFSVTLSNTNGTGTIYYTLDGTAPTRENGIRYTGSISIPSSGTTLKAVVWPSGANAVSGLPLAITYQSLVEAVGIPGVVWTNDAALPWTVSKTSGGISFKGFKKLDLTTGYVTSTIKCQVYGPGTIRFNYTILTGGGSQLLFKVKGEELGNWCYAYNDEFVHHIDSSGATELSWTYKYHYLDSAEIYTGEFCNIVWMPNSAPDPVDGLTASQGKYAYGTLLRWTASENAKSYVIYRNTANDPSGATSIGTTGQCQYWDRECEVGKTHWYWVKAVNGYGESEFSMSVSGWRPVVFSVTYSANGGTGKMNSQTCVSGESLAVSENGFRFPGYIFIGWAMSADGTVAYGPGDSLTPTADTILYAVWEASPFVFGGNAEWMRLDGGVWQSGAIDDYGETWIQQTVSGPGTVTFDWNVSSEGGYDKLRFLVDGTEKDAISGTSGTWTTKSYDVVGSGDHVLRWVYSKDSSSYSGSDCGWVRNVAWSAIFTVTFDANGGTGGTSMSLHSGDVLSIPTVVRTGYAFSGWIPEVPAMTPESNATYVAQWTVNQYTVTFDANGGTGTMAAQTFVYDEEQLLNECAFTLPNYEFRGWSLSADSDDIAYFDGENVVNLTDVANGSVTLYAVWEHAPAQVQGRTMLWTPVAPGGEAMFTGEVAETYNGYVQDSEGSVVGTILVKAAKAKNASSKLTAKIQLVTKKKLTVKGSLDTSTGKFEGEDGSGRRLSLLVGENGLSGTYGPYFIDGAQNKFTTKRTASKALGTTALAKWQGTWSVAWPDADGWSGASLSVAAKGKVKVSCVLANGTKVSASSQLLVGDGGVCAVPVVITKKVKLAFNVWFSDAGVEVVGLDGAVAGKAGSLKSGAAFRLDAAALSSLWGQTALPYLPDGVAVAQNGNKWVVASGAKAGKVVYLKGTTDVDADKLGDNPSGLKITFTAKTGTFKGSFKAYADVNGAPKSTKVNISGVLVDGVGYGAVTIKKVGGIPITVE